MRAASVTSAAANRCPASSVGSSLDPVAGLAGFCVGLAVGDTEEPPKWLPPGRILSLWLFGLAGFCLQTERTWQGPVLRADL